MYAGYDPEDKGAKAKIDSKNRGLRFFFRLTSDFKVIL